MDECARRIGVCQRRRRGHTGYKMMDYINVEGSYEMTKRAAKDREKWRNTM